MYKLGNINSSDIAIIHTKKDWFNHLVDIQLLRDNLNGIFLLQIIANDFDFYKYSETNGRLLRTRPNLEPQRPDLGQRGWQVCQLKSFENFRSILNFRYTNFNLDYESLI